MICGIDMFYKEISFSGLTSICVKPIKFPFKLKLIKLICMWIKEQKSFLPLWKRFKDKHNNT